MYENRTEPYQLPGESYDSYQSRMKKIRDKRRRDYLDSSSPSASVIPDFSSTSSSYDYSSSSSDSSTSSSDSFNGGGGDFGGGGSDSSW